MAMQSLQAYMASRLDCKFKEIISATYAHITWLIEHNELLKLTIDMISFYLTHNMYRPPITSSSFCATSSIEQPLRRPVPMTFLIGLITIQIVLHGHGLPSNKLIDR